MVVGALGLIEALELVAEEGDTMEFPYGGLVLLLKELLLDMEDIGALEGPLILLVMLLKPEGTEVALMLGLMVLLVGALMLELVLLVVLLEGTPEDSEDVSLAEEMVLLGGKDMLEVEESVKGSALGAELADMEVQGKQLVVAVGLQGTVTVLVTKMPCSVKTVLKVET